MLSTGVIFVGLSSAFILGDTIAGADTGQGDTGRGAPKPAVADTTGASTSRTWQSRQAASSSALETDDPLGGVRTSRQRAVRSGGAGAREQADPNNFVPSAVSPVVDRPPVPLPASPPEPPVVPAAMSVTSAPRVEPAATTAATAMALGASGVPPASTPRFSAVPVAIASVPTPQSPAVMSAMAGVLDGLSGLGWLSQGSPVAAIPALASFSSQRASARPAAVVGTEAAAAAPPDPTAGSTNGVTGVQAGHSRLAIPGAFIGDSVAADWYFPTQADGSVRAQGVIWLQHGFMAAKDFYGALATQLASTTNSIVVVPTLSSIPSPFSGGWLNGAVSQQAAASAFLDPDRAALVNSAVAAGYASDVGELLGRFALTGHSAGGGFAAAVAATYLDGGSDTQDANLLGVVMFDGVSNGAFDGSFAKQVGVLTAADKPIYQIAAPAQVWNAFGDTTNQLLATRPGQFGGVVLARGSHIDSMLGKGTFVDALLQLVVGRSPAGNTAATHTLSTGWINDFYAGATPNSPLYGLYAPANQQIIMGAATAIALPTPIANHTTVVGGVLKSLTDFVFRLFGIPPTPAVNTGSNGVTVLVG